MGDLLLEHVGFLGVFCARWMHGLEVDSVRGVLHKVEVPREYGGVCVLWFNLSANLSMESKAFGFLFMA